MHAASDLDLNFSPSSRDAMLFTTRNGGRELAFCRVHLRQPQAPFSMLGHAGPRILHKSTRPGQAIVGQGRRGFFREAIQGASDGFLDLAQALPIPPSLPPYSTTIILLTVVTRLALTVPFSIWAKKRQWRAEELVAPVVIAEQPKVQERILNEMRHERMRGSKDELRQQFTKRVQKAVASLHLHLHPATVTAELLSKHHCNPIATMLIPPVTQLPVFAGTSIMLSNISQPPTVFDSESFLTLTSLSHADPTATLPIVLGLITLANVESSRWFMSSAGLAREQQEEKRVTAKRAQGHLVIEPKKIVQFGLRTLSVGRILIGAVVPGGVVLYWVSSATFGLFQTWVFDWWERRRARLRLAQLDGATLTKAAPVVPSKPTKKKKKAAS
ncbi:hypothetical protein EVG20_g8310 [Dentipellis fragilis]|uniref:Membrane insertase YidC/Oxa/ALB C-terminal domain-containing protein n=1 Tax=Dentipellis fragilis TaxID=205917 RepID=A0A4Y9Y9A0_9AGAM|nr:hypothetical protein EVG20_g8310 [Dentipellis fragilis]